MARVNATALRVLVAKDSTGKLKAAAEERAETIFNEAVIAMQVAFEDHPVTREIAGGINSENISNTLPGAQYAPRNLFAFIGFPKDSRPLDPIRDALNPDSKIGRKAGPKMVYKGKDVQGNNPRFTWSVVAPDKQLIYKATPMPWAQGWSWAQKIETRIPGFAHFLAKFMPNADDQLSRSKGGTQLKQQIRKAEYQPPENGYLTGIFNDFLNQIRSYRKGGFKRKLT